MSVERRDLDRVPRARRAGLRIDAASELEVPSQLTWGFFAFVNKGQ
jgi:hypothetical protein